MAPSRKPGKVQAIAIMVLVGGIVAVFLGLVWFLSLAMTCIGLLWPGPYYAIVAGILAIIKGAKLLGKEDYKQKAPKTIAIMQIICIVNCDIANLALGIVTLVFLGDEEVKAYYRG
jgi:hypothetical protein